MSKISQLPSISPTGKEQVVLFDGDKTARAFLSELKLDDATGSLLTSAILAGVLIAVPIAGDTSALRVDLDTAANGESFDVLIVAGNSKAVTRLTAGGITRDVVGPGAVPIAAGDLGRGKIATFAYSLAGGGFVLLGQRDLTIAGGAPSSTYDDDFAERPWGDVSFPGGVRKVDRLTKYVVVPGSSNANAAYVPAAQMPANVASAALNEFFPGEDMIFSGVTVARPGAPMVDIASQLADSIPYQAGQAGWVIPFFWMNDARTLFYHDQGGILAEIAALRRMIPEIRTKGAEPVLVTGFPPDPRASDVALDPNYYADVGANAGMTFPAVKPAPVHPETDMYPPKSGQLTPPTAWTVTGIKRTGYKRIEHVNRLIRELAAETGCVLLDLEYSTYRHVIETIADLGAGLDTYYNQADPLHPKPALYEAAVTPVLREWAAAVARGDTSQRIYRGDANATAQALIAFDQARAETTIAMAAAIASATAEADRAGRNSQQAGVFAATSKDLRDLTGNLADRAKANAAAVVSQAAIVAATANEVMVSREVYFQLAGIAKTYATKAAMQAAPLPEPDAFVQVLTDPSYRNRRTIYQNQAGTLARVSADDAHAPQTIWFDPQNGNDVNGDGSQARPIRTHDKLKSIAQPYDTVKFVPNAVITEPWNMNRDGNPLDNMPLNYDCTGGVVFQQMNNLMTAWTPAGPDYPNIYYATVVHSFGATDGSFMSPGQGFGAQMLIDQTRLIDKQLAAVVAEGNTYATEKEALASVQATPGSFYVRGKNGSNMQKGWQAGDQTYFVHCPDGTSPAGHLVNYGDRMAPIFGEYSKLWGKITVFGGVGHNGVIQRACTVEDMDILYPCHHAQFCLGMHGKRVWVRHGNRTHGGYAWHDFGGSGTFLDRDTILEDCGTSDYFDAGNTMFGIHGTDDTVSPYVGRQLITRNFRAYNVSSVNLGGGNHRFGSVHYDMTVAGVTNMDASSGFEAYNLKVIGGHLTPASGSLWGSSNVQPNGQKCVVQGGYSIAAPGQQLFAVSCVDLTFIDHHLLFEGDYTNGRWLQGNAGPSKISFVRCVVECVSGGIGSLGYSASGQITLDFEDCHLAGINITPDANLTVNQRGTVHGGRSGLGIGGDGTLIAAPLNTVPQLGYDIIGATSAFLGGSVAVLSSRGLYYVYAEGLFNNSNAWVPPANVTLTGIANGGNTNVIYGRDGTVFRVGRGDPTPENVVRVAGAPYKNFTGAISGVENFYDSDLFLLGEDGSITQYRPQTDTFTARVSPVAYALRGGTYNHNASGQVIAWGDGGVIVSNDFGVTWANSISQNDGTIFSDRYDQVSCCGWANGQFFVWFNFGVLLTSVTGAKGSWSRQYLDLPYAIVRSMAVDVSKGIGVCVADMQGGNLDIGKGTRTQAVIRIDISNPDGSKWSIKDVLDPPMPTLKTVVHQQNAAQSRNIFCFVGKVAQVAQSDTGQSGRVSARPTAFRQTQFVGYRDKERTKAVQPTG